MNAAIAFDFVLLGAIWGSSFLFTRLAVVEFGAIPSAAMRVAIAAAFLLPLVALRGHLPVFRREWRRIAVIGLINSGIPFALFAFALLSITTGLTAILNATVPLFGAIVAWLWLGDRLNAARVLGLAIGFTGMAMLAWDKAGFRPEAVGLAPLWAILACLAACVMYGVAASAAKRYLAGLPALVTAAGSQVGATLGLAVPAALTWPAQAPGGGAWLAVIVAGVLCTGLAYILYFRLIEHAGPSRAVAVTFVIPVFAIVYGAIFLDEPVTSWMLFCGLIVVAGTALATGVLRFGNAGARA